jgi:hypothetical protein
MRVLIKRKWMAIAVVVEIFMAVATASLRQTPVYMIICNCWSRPALAGFSIAIWFLVLVFRQAAGKRKNWTETASGAMTVAALLGCVGILVHSFLDFNLQIPANAALFYVLCAIAASAPLHESQRRRVVRRHNLIVQPSPESTAS